MVPCHSIVTLLVPCHHSFVTLLVPCRHTFVTLLVPCQCCEGKKAKKQNWWRHGRIFNTVADLVRRLAEQPWSIAGLLIFFCLYAIKYGASSLVEMIDGIQPKWVHSSFLHVPNSSLSWLPVHVACTSDEAVSFSDTKWGWGGGGEYFLLDFLVLSHLKPYCLGFQRCCWNNYGKLLLRCCLKTYLWFRLHLWLSKDDHRLSKGEEFEMCHLIIIFLNLFLDLVLFYPCF